MQIAITLYLIMVPVFMAYVPASLKLNGVFPEGRGARFAIVIGFSVLWPLTFAAMLIHMVVMWFESMLE